MEEAVGQAMDLETMEEAEEGLGGEGGGGRRGDAVEGDEVCSGGL